MIKELMTKQAELTHADAIGERRDEDGQLLCYYCGQSLDGDKHIDHIFPVSLGGPDAAWNLVLTCPTCNLNKHAKHPLTWLKILSPDWPDDLSLDFMARLFIGLGTSTFMPQAFMVGLSGMKLDVDVYEFGYWGMCNPKEPSPWRVVINGYHRAPDACPDCGRASLMSKCSQGTFALRVNCPGCGLLRVFKASPTEFPT